MRNFEQELKLELTKREYDILKNVSNATGVVQNNHYFVTKERETMVRIRQKGKEYLFCFKRRLTNSNGVSICDERECEIDENFAKKLISNGVSSSTIKKLVDVDMDCDTLPYAGVLSTERTTFNLQDWRIELDKNDYLGVTDYELECENNYVENLEKLKNYLSFNFRIEIRPSSPKSQRFFDRLKG